MTTSSQRRVNARLGIILKRKAFK